MDDEVEVVALIAIQKGVSVSSADDRTLTHNRSIGQREGDIISTSAVVIHDEFLAVDENTSVVGNPPKSSNHRNSAVIPDDRDGLADHWGKSWSRHNV